MVTVGPFYDKTDQATIETGLTITNERITLTADTDNGSAPTNILDNIPGAVSGTSNDLDYITDNDAGMMRFELTAANVNRVGRMLLSITDAVNHAPVVHEFMVMPALVYDTFFAASGGATFPAATLASTTNITAGTIAVVTSVTNGVKSYEDGSIWVDTVNGATGTTLYTHGMATTPVAFVTDVTSLIGSAKIKRVQVVNASSITLETAHTGEEWKGESWTLALGGRNIGSSHFIGATVSGTGTGGVSEFMECSIGTVTLPASTLKSCGMSGTFTVSGAGIYTFDQCYSEVAAGGDWILDFGAAVGATTLGLRHWAGTIDVRNMQAGDVLVVAGTGKLTIASSCTAGAVQIRGMIELVNNGSGQTITDTSRYNEDQGVGSLATQAKADVNAEVVDALATDTYTEPGQGSPAATAGLAAKINYIYKWMRNKKTNDGTTIKFYADNTTTVDQKATVGESGGTVTKGEIATGP